jgi:hypothetical protein
MAITERPSSGENLPFTMEKGRPFTASLQTFPSCFIEAL